MPRSPAARGEVLGRAAIGSEVGGHDWQSALFPSGDGFHFMRFMKPDGSLEWSEAFVLKSGRVVSAEVLSDTRLATREVVGEVSDPPVVRVGETVIEGIVLGGISGL